MKTFFLFFRHLIEYLISYTKVVGICFIGLFFTCLEGDEGIECDVDEEESSDIWDNAINNKKKILIKF